ncbi:hypothetical protein LOC51_21015 [Rubrivivax sp. JA1024]|nr:hypothetical protein [Rubrivivax sp. JA1024]
MIGLTGTAGTLAAVCSGASAVGTDSELNWRAPNTTAATAMQAMINVENFIFNPILRIGGSRGRAEHRPALRNWKHSTPTLLTRH